MHLFESNLEGYPKPMLKAAFLHLFPHFFRSCFNIIIITIILLLVRLTQAISKILICSSLSSSCYLEYNTSFLKEFFNLLRLISTICVHTLDWSKFCFLQVYRHGDRSPVSGFKTDIHMNFWPQGLGQLTQV